MPHPVKRARAKNPKPKTCRHCGQVYTPAPNSPSFRVWCSVDCGVAISIDRQDKARAKAQAKKAVQARAEHRVRKEALKPRSKWLQEAQQAFNGYIRERDKGRPCISSGVFEQERFTGGHFDAGHYRSTGAAPHLRFNTYNCHGQSKRDNRELSGNVVEYRKGLIERIGLAKVYEIEHNNCTRKFDIEYLKRLKTIFNRRARHIRRLRDDTQ